MKKKIISLLVAATILTSSAVMVSAATDPSVCEHPLIVNITYGDKVYASYTHPVCVAYNPTNGAPIFADCAVKETRIKWKRTCSECQQIFSTWETIESMTHSISH